MAGSRRAGQLELEAQLPAGDVPGEGLPRPEHPAAARGPLVLVTDGVLEAGAPGPEFDEQRLAGLLLATAGRTPHQCVAEVLRTRRSYATRMHDDATVICLDWNAPTTTVPA